MAAPSGRFGGTLEPSDALDRSDVPESSQRCGPNCARSVGCAALAARHTGGMPRGRRDRLRELLDAVLDGTDLGRSASLRNMADAAAPAAFHFAPQLSRGPG